MLSIQSDYFVTQNCEFEINCKKRVLEICIEAKVNVINEIVVESGCLLGGFHNAVL
jgi:hypothetical protein